MPWTCPDCNKVVREGFEYLQISYCVPCGQKRVGNDLRLAQLIHRLPVGWSLHNYSGNTWSVINGINVFTDNNPIDALLAAGITDD